MTTWTQIAEELGDAMCELGAAAGHLFACAWRARVDLDALGALAGAATALRQRLKLTLRGEVLPTDREMRERAEDLEADAGELLGTGRQMTKDCESDWERACDDLRKAEAALKAANDDKARSAAREAATAARTRMADCEVALEILADVTSRLAWAVNCLQRVPDDLSVTYEAAYSLRRRGIALPADGDFLTGTPATPVHPAHAVAG